ncbi:MAG: class I SAM-dependent methyltransferase [Methanobacteriota archaeon]
MVGKTGVRDLGFEYDQMLDKGISLSGEKKDFFMAGRVKGLIEVLPPSFTPKSILDYGCGTGDTTVFLSEKFSNSKVLGVDVDTKIIDYASEKRGGGRVRFKTVGELDDSDLFDLCYMNGVLHHVDPSERLPYLRKIFNVLKPGGFFSLFENNPFNPGTRLVMKRIPFDKDAVTLSYLQAKRILKQAEFTHHSTRFLFFFPNFLKTLRFMEPWLKRTPLGAQYLILSEKKEESVP